MYRENGFTYHHRGTRYMPSCTIVETFVMGCATRVIITTQET